MGVEGGGGNDSRLKYYNVRIYIIWYSIIVYGGPVHLLFCACEVGSFDALSSCIGEWH